MAYTRARMRRPQVATRASLHGALAELAAHAVVRAPALLPPPDAAHLARRILDARDAWTADFGGAQYSLGRAFYTHLETGRAGEYFAHAREADATVERVAPGLQAALRARFAEAVAGVARARVGYCGPGVHVFPAGSEVARRGGVAHWDVEGLAPEHTARGRRAATLVVTLQAPARGGALRVWDAVWNGRDDADAGSLATPTRDLRTRPGDALFFASYRLHQIRPFTGPLARVTATVHGVEVDAGVWDTWF